MKLEKNTAFSGSLQSSDGTPDVAYTAEVSPCCWMYPGYGLQLSVSIESGGNVLVHDKSIPFSEATIEQARAMAEKVRVCKCSCCDRPAFDPSTAQTNRNGQCKKCFMDNLNAEFAAEQKKIDDKLKRKDKSMKAKGFTHRVEAWVHPFHGGDDYQVSIWMQNPTAQMIRGELKRQGSSVLTDYTVIVL